MAVRTITNHELNNVNFLTGQQETYEAYEAGRKYRDLILDILDFTTKIYSDERKWDEKFLAWLKEQALKNDVRNSFAVLLYQGKIAGSFRLTFAPYQVFVSKSDSKKRIVTSLGHFPSIQEFKRESGKNTIGSDHLPFELATRRIFPRVGMQLRHQSEWLPHVLEQLKNQSYKYKHGRDGEQESAIEELESLLQDYDCFLGITIEPSSYAIDKNLGPELQKEVFNQLMIGEVKILNNYKTNWWPNKTLNLVDFVHPDYPINVTYGGSVSQRLYGSKYKYLIDHRIDELELLPEWDLPKDWRFLYRSLTEGFLWYQNDKRLRDNWQLREWVSRLRSKLHSREIIAEPEAQKLNKNGSFQSIPAETYLSYPL